ncbi:MAG TPA: 4Fe-4S binding protein [Thermoleophilia bacterium]|nr:4Fe-4S binding protein [Thermoleophilia bacterium]
MEHFGAPEFLGPYLGRFFEEADTALVHSLRTGPLTPDELCGRLPQMDAAGLERAHRRGMVDHTPGGLVTLADFHARFEIWAIFEGWKDIPADMRAALNRWAQDAYLERKRAQIEDLQAGREPESHLENSEYLLLHEAITLLDRAERIYLWPCNCRSMMGACSKPVNTCIRFSNERGVGWEISRERAREIVREANRAGLMQTGEVAELEGAVIGAICNCCTDCCYPHLVSARLGAEKLWPRSRYLARLLPGLCTACGRCARRCPFGAFVASTRESADTGAARLEITFVEDLCRGCGVCATGCPEDAIAMDPLPATGPGAPSDSSLRAVPAALSTPEAAR